MNRKITVVVFFGFTVILIGIVANMLSTNDGPLSVMLALISIVMENSLYVVLLKEKISG